MFVLDNLPNEATGRALNQFNKEKPYGVCFPNSQILLETAKLRTLLGHEECCQVKQIDLRF